MQGETSMGVNRRGGGGAGRERKRSEGLITALSVEGKKVPRDD